MSQNACLTREKPKGIKYRYTPGDVGSPGADNPGYRATTAETCCKLVCHADVGSRCHPDESVSADLVDDGEVTRRYSHPVVWAARQPMWQTIRSTSYVECRSFDPVFLHRWWLAGSRAYASSPQH